MPILKKYRQAAVVLVLGTFKSSRPDIIDSHPEYIAEMVIAFLRGTLQAREVSGGPVDRIVVDVSGVGFEALVSRSTAVQAGQIGELVTLHTSLSIRENEWQLFGFARSEEKEMFSLLQSVTGVGPKMALSLVGTLGPSTIAESIGASDQKTLSQAPGVGAKLAQRIILELKSKMEDWQIKKGSTSMPPSKSLAREEAKQILQDLGYTLTEISQVFKRLPEETGEEDVEMLVSQSLRVLGTSDR